MARNHRHGTIQGTVAEAYRAAGGIECAAADIGLSISTLSEATDIPRNAKRCGGLGINHLDNLSRTSPAAAAVIARHFAELAGGIFQQVQIGGSVVSLHESVGVAAKEGGEATAASISAVGSGSLESLVSAHRENAEAIAALLTLQSQLAPMIAKLDRRAG